MQPVVSIAGRNTDLKASTRVPGFRGDPPPVRWQPNAGRRCHALDRNVRTHSSASLLSAGRIRARCCWGGWLRTQERPRSSRERGLVVLVDGVGFSRMGAPSLRHCLAPEVPTRTPPPPDSYSNRPLDHLLFRARSTRWGPTHPVPFGRPSRNLTAARTRNRLISLCTECGQGSPGWGIA